MQLEECIEFAKEIRYIGCRRLKWKGECDEMIKKKYQLLSLEVAELLKAYNEVSTALTFHESF